MKLFHSYRKIIPVLLSVVAAGIVLLVACTKDSKDEKNEPETPSLGSISGLCYDETTGDPVARAMVSLVPASITQFTGEEGSFEFTDLEPLQYTVIVQKTGYETNRHIVKVQAGKTTTTGFMMRKTESKK